MLVPVAGLPGQTGSSWRKQHFPVPCGSGWWCLVTECGAARAQVGQELVQHPRDACPARELGRLSQAQPSSSEVRP